MRDFLKRDVKTPLCGRYTAAGVRLKIETNSESILAIARSHLEQPAGDHGFHEDVRLKLWVEDEHTTGQDAKPYFRGLGHLVFSGYDDRSSLLINLRNRCGAGRFTRALAENARYWKTILFPSLLAIVGPSVGLTSLHSACVAWKGRGLLLVGDSGAGKSTLSLALVRAGLDFLCDDRTLIRRNHETLTAWGLSSEMKQRTDATVYFPELTGSERREVWKEDSVLRFDPVEFLGISRVPSCEPGWIVFLERQAAAEFSLEDVLPEEAAFRLQQDLHEESPEATERQRLTIEALSRRACYRLRYDGNPHKVAVALRDLFLENRTPTSQTHRCLETKIAKTSAPALDPLRRFRATCLHADVLLMGKRIRIETDSPVVLQRVSEVFNQVEPARAGLPQVLWRIVCEPGKESSGSWPAMAAFGDRSLRYINLGQRSFVAADLIAREAVGVLAESLCKDDIGFSVVLLASLLHLTAPALGLTPVSAACVAKGQNGLLLFGPANSGKTAACYSSRKLGLEFHADQTTFLELESGAVHAWGDFWPAAFRPETVRLFPELSKLGRSFTYHDQGFIFVDKAPRAGAKPRRVTPAACILLERRSASSPRLIPLSRAEMEKQLLTDEISQDDHNTALALLGRVPAYRLLYDEDPSIAASFFRSVLDAHELMEQRA